MRKYIWPVIVFILSVFTLVKICPLLWFHGSSSGLEMAFGFAAISLFGIAWSLNEI